MGTLQLATKLQCPAQLGCPFLQTFTKSHQSLILCFVMGLIVLVVLNRLSERATHGIRASGSTSTLCTRSSCSWPLLVSLLDSPVVWPLGTLLLRWSTRHELSGIGVHRTAWARVCAATTCMTTPLAASAHTQTVRRLLDLASIHHPAAECLRLLFHHGPRLRHEGAYSLHAVYHPYHAQLLEHFQQSAVASGAGQMLLDQSLYRQPLEERSLPDQVGLEVHSADERLVQEDRYLHLQPE